MCPQSLVSPRKSAGDFPPTEQGEAYRQQVSAQIDAELEAPRTLQEEGLPEINLMIRMQEIAILDAP